MSCVFENCPFKTNIHGTFASHRSRKHTPHTLDDFKPELLQRCVNPLNAGDDPVDEDDTEGAVSEDPEGNEIRELPNLIEKHVAHVLLKLESIFNVPQRCIDELVEELHFISSSASGPILKEILQSCLKKHNCEVDDLIISEMVTDLCECNPITLALGHNGPLSTSYKRREYFKEHFSVVEPIEYMLSAREQRSFQYVPILKSLHEVLKKKEIQDLLTSSNEADSSSESQYKSFQDGTHFKNNTLLSENNPAISLILYVDDFEVCNPLGTSRKKHKITAVYWVLANVPPLLRSSLTSIYLAILCKADDIKKFGYSAVFEPMLKDLASLEEEGLYIPSLDIRVKGTVYCVVADNLGAHSIGGFVESFSSTHVCRFCLGERSQFQVSEVRTGAFKPRTIQEHKAHVQTAQGHNHCYGVKRQCPLTERLKHFDVLSGYPPDLLHDLFEGIVPFELALCLNALIKKKYFALDELNKLIKEFPYRWADKSDSPQAVPLAFATRKTVAGNAHENWALLRLLPLIVGERIPESEPTWLVILNLKDIVELVLSPVHTDLTICFLESKISEHRHRFLETFPQERLIPKHHFLEHYPQLIKAFGPLVSLWTMRFEAKHSFFKRVVRHTHSFRNILLSLAVKHQFMVAHHLHGGAVVPPSLQATKLSIVDLTVLREDIKKALQVKFPSESFVQMATTVCCSGTSYSTGMILAHGSTGCLPDFVELIQIAVVNGKVCFIVKCLNAWYIEHLRSYELENTRSVKVIELSELSDIFPMAAYTVAGKRIVTQKRYIYVHV